MYCGGRRARIAADGSYVLNGIRPGAHAIIAANSSGIYRFGSTTGTVAGSAGSDTKQDPFLPPCDGASPPP